MKKPSKGRPGLKRRGRGTSLKEGPPPLANDEADLRARLAALEAANIALAAQLEECRRADRGGTGEVVRSSEERYALAQRIAGVGTWEWDLVTQEVHGSDEMLAILGIRREVFRGVLDDVAGRIHPDDRDQWEHSVQECLEEGREHRIEVRVIWPDGSVHWISAVGDAPPDADGQRRRMLGVVIDVTERKRAERALEENERFLGAIFDSIQDGISVLNSDLTIRRVNGVMRQWYARQLPLEGRTCYSCYHDRGEACDPCPTIRCIRSGRTESEIVPGLPGSPVEWVELFSYPMKDPESGAVTGVVEFVRDITTRKRAEDELLREKHFSDTLINSLPGIWYLYDEDLNILRWNRNHELLTGFSGEELRQRKVMDWFSEEEQGEVSQALQQLWEEGQATVEASLLMKDGRRVPYLFTAARLDGFDTKMFMGAGVDISDLKRAEQALRSSEERFRAIFDTMFQLIGLLKPDGTVIEVNRAALDFAGLKRDEVVGRPFWEGHWWTASSETREQLQAAIRRAAGGEFVRYLADIRGAGNRVASLDFSLKPIRDEAGEVVLLIPEGRDITEHKRAEKALAISERRLRATLDNTPNVAVQWYDQRGRVLYWNPASERIYGWSAAEAAGKTLDALILTPEEAVAFRESLARIRASGTALDPYETSIRRRDGSEGVVLSTVFAIPGPGERSVSVCMDIDISELKRAEAALRNSEEHLRVALSAAEMGTWRWNPLTDEDTRDPGLNWILGFEAAESTRSLDEFFARVHPEDRVAARAEFDRAIRDQNTYLAEFRIVRPDGTIRWLRNQGRPFCDEAGKLMYVTGAAVDITARKHAEQERNALESQLRQAQKLDAIGQLAGGVAHDFNNILTAVLGHVELARAALQPHGAGDEMLLDSIREIERGAERASQLTRQLLAFSRRQLMQPQVLDLNDTATDMEKMLRRLLSENIVFDVIRRPKLNPVRVDRGQIEQVILNLVVNARDAMPDGGTLTIETRNVLLDDAYAASHAEARPGRHVMLSVSDTGCGMETAVMDRVFEPFFTTKGVGEGTGLGLATVYGIVKQAGGHITVYSEAGRGSTFKVYLPAVVDAEPELRTERGEPGVPGGSETVMVCEDDEAVRQLTEHLLRSAGYTVLAARNGKHAEEIFARREEPIHLLVTDVIMPGSDGRKLADWLANRQPGLRVLFVSGYTSSLIAHHGVLDEGVEFLEKPFSRQSLLRRVRDLLDRGKPRG